MSTATKTDLGALMKITHWWNGWRRNHGLAGQHRSLGMSTYEFIRMLQVGR